MCRWKSSFCEGKAAPEPRPHPRRLHCVCKWQIRAGKVKQKMRQFLGHKQTLTWIAGDWRRNTQRRYLLVCFHSRRWRETRIKRLVSKPSAPHSPGRWLLAASKTFPSHGDMYIVGTGCWDLYHFFFLFLHRQRNRGNKLEFSPELCRKNHWKGCCCGCFSLSKEQIHRFYKHYIHHYKSRL